MHDHCSGVQPMPKQPTTTFNALHDYEVVNIRSTTTIRLIWTMKNIASNVENLYDPAYHSWTPPMPRQNNHAYATIDHHNQDHERTNSTNVPNHQHSARQRMTCNKRPTTRRQPLKCTASNRLVSLSLVSPPDSGRTTWGSDKSSSLGSRNHYSNVQNPRTNFSYSEVALRVL